MSLKLMSAVISTSITSQNTNKFEDSKILLNQLLECVQNCQKRFGGKTELATEFDSCVIALCFTLERVLSHGLRSKPLEITQTSTLKQVSGIVTGSLLIGNENFSFWLFVKNHLTRHEQERYAVLKNIHTDIGKGRAWIRASLNERSLERYIHSLLGDTKALEIHFEDWALLRDHEKNSMLPNMAAGLASILFAISIDKAELNDLNSQQKLLSSFSKPEPVIEAPVQDPTKITKEKKKKKVARQFISFDEDSLLSSSIPSSSGSLSSDGSSLNETQYSFDLAKHSKKKQSYTNCNMEDKKIEKKVEVKRKLSIENSGTFTKYSTGVPETLTPISQMEVGELTPISVEMGREDRSPDLSDDLVEAPSDISAVLTAVENKNEEERKRFKEKVESLNKENDTLKEQVNKYLSVLKMLGKDPNEENLDEIEELPNYKSEAEIFERKLVQVAEMHAELMDFNVHLQQVICEKDKIMERLKTELEILRGPMSPEDINLEENMTNVHVWIPSAFLTGAGSDSHHVYQIFLRAGNDEWNIYRRYAQFHALHADLKKVDPAIASFDFPPKKTIGRKDATLVESRRKRLQTYLRRILTHWPELSHCSGRHLLEQHLSFFKDQKDNESTARNTRRSNENHYTGL